MRLEGFDDPLPYSRFPAVVVRKYPFGYDKRSRKYHISKLVELEYPHIAKQKGYEVDIFHYVGNSILAELGAFICMEPQFRLKATGDTEEELIAAYKLQLKSAKRYLKDFIDQYMIKYSTGQGTIFKYLYKEIYKNHVNELSTNFNTFDFRQFSIVFNINYIECVDIFSGFIKNITTIAKVRAKTSKKKYMTNLKAQLVSIGTNTIKEDIIRMIKDKIEVNKTIKDVQQERIDELEKELYGLKDEYLRIYKLYNAKLGEEITSIRNSLNIEDNNNNSIFTDELYNYVASKLKSIDYSIYIDNADKGTIEKLLSINNSLILSRAYLFEIDMVMEELQQWHAAL